MNISYIRVSSIDQHTDRQDILMQNYNIHKTFTEKISGKDTNRPVLQQMLSFAREGDKIYIADFSRISRSVRDMLNLLTLLSERGIGLVSIKENFDSTDDSPTSKLMMHIFSSLAEWERSVILDRQRAGVDAAKLKGVYKGRRPVQIKDFDKHYIRLQQKEISKSQLAVELGIARQTLYNLISQYEEAMS